MASTRDNLNLFGLDLSGVPGTLRQGWKEAMQWRFFRWLLPAEPVRLLLPDGGEAVWPVAARATRIAATAVVLPEDILLRRALRLPNLADAEQRQAIELALRAESPFPVDSLAWGYRVEHDGRQVGIELAFAARAHVEQYLSQRLPSQGTSDTHLMPEVWASGEQPLVFQGFGEQSRMQRERRQRWRTLGLALVCLGLLLALLASPVAHLRAQVLALNDRFETLSREVAPIVADRDALSKANLRLQSVAAYVQAHPDPRGVLGALSNLLPDTVHLTRLEVRGRTVIIGGLADNAAGLMEMLGAQGGFRDVRAPAAISRDPVSGRESFTIEFKLADAEVAR